MSEAIHSFAAQAFHPSLGNEVAEGSILIDRWNFRFESEATTLEIPLARLQARFGEGDDERIIFSDPANPEWKIYTLDERVLEHPGLQAGNRVHEQLSSQATRRELRRRLKQLAWVAGVCLILIWLGQFAVSAMVRSLVARVPPSLEQELGGEMIAELQELMPFIEDQQRIKSLVTLAGPLTRTFPNGGTNFQFYLVEMNDPNAFALPGGHVVVTTGLLEMSDRPEQVLGVLAHELAHVTKQHGLRQAIAAAGPFLIIRGFLGGGGGGLGGLLGQASELLVRSSFSQEYEHEADEEGWRVLVAARIDPRGMTETFEKLHAYETARNNALETPQAFSTHPALTKRIARLEKKWQQQPQQDGFQNLQALAPHLRAAAGQ